MPAPAINPTLTRSFIQPGGLGNDVYTLPPETNVGAASGGSVSFESDFAGRAYVGSRQTSNPERWTFDLMSRRITVSRLRNLALTPQCLNTVYVLNGCDNVDFSNFLFGEMYIDSGFGGLSASDNISNRTEQTDPKLMDTVSVSAGVRLEFHPLAHASAGGTTFGNSAIMHILNLNNARCSGYCGEYSVGDQEFIAVLEGISPATIPRIAYTANAGNTWTIQTIAAVANGVAENVAVMGENVIVAVSGTNGGVYRANLTAVKAGTATFTAVTGIATGAAYNAVLAVGSLVFAAGAAGALYVSRDGGFSFTALSSGVATALNALAGDDENIVWAGGASGVLLRIRNGSIVGNIGTITGIGTDAITALAVPANRTNELYIGTITGEIWRTRNGTAGTPTWAELSFDKPSGGGIIEALAFSDAMGATFWVVQSNSTTQSRVLIDRSGGRMGVNAVAIGTFTDPANALILTIAPAHVDYGLTGGEPVSSNGFLGKIFA